MKTKTKNFIIQGLRWSVFIMTALTIGIKIAEVSANETLKILIQNPELCNSSVLVQSGYLIFF